MRRTIQKGADQSQYEPSTLISLQVENASAQHDQMESQREACSRAKAVVEQMNTLVPSLKEWDPFSVLAFLSTYRYFATPLQVLDLVFVR